MAIKCGNTGRGGRHFHDTVQEVRACFNGTQVASQKAGTKAADALSPAQVNLVNILLRKLNLAYVGETPVEDLAKHGAGRYLIDDLKNCEVRQSRGMSFTPPEGTEVSSRPRTERQAEPQPGDYPVPEGLYATPSLTGNNDLDFWRVKHGRVKGRVFVNRVIGGHQDKNLPADSKARIKTERVAIVTQKTALAAILAFEGGPEKSHELAGTELKFCRECGIHLTDETSRALGIGPVCREK